MLPACRTDHAGYSLPRFDLVPRAVKGFMDVLGEFQSACHDCFARSEPRAHFCDYMVGSTVGWNAHCWSRWPSASRGHGPWAAAVYS